MSHIKWNDEYSLGIDAIDNQHKQFLELMDQAEDAFYKKENKEELAVLISNLKDYTWLHFGTEEKYFELFNYEFKDEHTRDHTALKDQLLNLIKRFESEGSNIVPSLTDFLENWLVKHMEYDDRKYVKIFKEHGL